MRYKILRTHIVLVENGDIEKICINRTYATPTGQPFTRTRIYRAPSLTDASISRLCDYLHTATIIHEGPAADGSGYSTLYAK